MTTIDLRLKFGRDCGHQLTNINIQVEEGYTEYIEWLESIAMKHFDGIERAKEMIKTVRG